MIAAALKTPRRLWISILGATLAVGCFSLAGDAPPPEALRERARTLEREMLELREQGHHQEAERLQGELREIREHAELMRRERPQGDPDRPLPPEQIRERQEMMRHIRELMGTGRQEEAAELRQELARREREMGRQPGRPGPPGRPDEPAPREEMERRLHHMEIAADNLHAAGLHDVAERLEQQLGQQRERMERRGPPRGVEPPIGRLGEELRRVRAELEELRANLNELRQQMGELHREGR